MKRLRKFAVLAGFAFALASPGAWAMGLFDVSVQGGLNDTVSSGGGAGYLAGAGLNFWLGPVSSLEVDAQYVSRGFSGAASNVNWIEVPVLLRYSILPEVTLGAGGFYDFPVTSGADGNDGLVASARVKLPALPLFVDGRFNLGLKNDVAGNKLNDLQLMVGILF